MSQKLPLNNCEWIKDTSQSNKDFIKNYNEESALNLALVLKKIHNLIKFNQNAWLKPYIDMNTDLRKKAKSDLEEKLF